MGMGGGREVGREVVEIRGKGGGCGRKKKC